MSDLNILKKECLGCTKCAIGGVQLDNGLSNVFSNMNTDADIMVVGQNPGSDEVKGSEPFIGESGKFFDKVMLEVCGLSRDDFYISNVVRCYTPGNRKPHQNEVDSCRVFLDREIELIKPKLIIGLGSFAFKQLTGMNGIMKHRGEVVFSIRYKTNVIPLLHPSPLNTQKDGRLEMFYEDLEKVKSYLENRDG